MHPESSDVDASATKTPSAWMPLCLGVGAGAGEDEPLQRCMRWQVPKRFGDVKRRWPRSFDLNENRNDGVRTSSELDPKSAREDPTAREDLTTTAAFCGATCDAAQREVSGSVGRSSGCRTIFGRTCKHRTFPGAILLARVAEHRNHSNFFGVCETNNVGTAFDTSASPRA